MNIYLRFPPVCLCGHDADDHARGSGRCRGLDSYGIRCACSGLEADTQDSEESEE